MHQTACDFATIGGGGVNGTIASDGTVAITVVDAGLLFPCSYSGGQLTGNGSISGNTITASVFVGAARFSVVIRKL